MTDLYGATSTHFPVATPDWVCNTEPRLCCAMMLMQPEPGMGCCRKCHQHCASNGEVM